MQRKREREIKTKTKKPNPISLYIRYVDITIRSDAAFLAGADIIIMMHKSRLALSSSIADLYGRGEWVPRCLSMIIKIGRAHV